MYLCCVLFDYSLRSHIYLMLKRLKLTHSAIQFNHSTVWFDLMVSPLRFPHRICPVRFHRPIVLVGLRLNRCQPNQMEWR